MRWGPSLICPDCRAAMTLAPDRLLPGGIVAIAAFEHTGPAASMIHALKYRGLDLILGPVAAVLGPRLRPGSAFVPVPRVWTRYLRYGIDPAYELAKRLARATGGDVAAVLRRPIHDQRRAGRDHNLDPVPISARTRVNKPVVVVDDVITTGRTVLGAIAAIGSQSTDLVVTATSARGVSSLSAPRGGPMREEPSGSNIWPLF